MVRSKGCRYLSKELIEPLPHRKWGLKDGLVQGGTSECDRRRASHYLLFPV